MYIVQKKDRPQGKVMSYMIEGDPVKLIKPRGMRYKQYDALRRLKELWVIELQQQHLGMPYFRGPLKIEITFFMPVPYKTSSKMAEKMIGGYHICKPFSSDMLKFVEDCAQGVIFDDDSQLCVIECKKIYDHNTRTEFTVTELL